MKTETKNDEILRQYLLGALNEGQADDLEQRLLAEGELFELAEAVEGDLLMAAARGELSPAERGHVLRRLAASPEGRARLALAKGLTSLSREQASVPAEVLVFQLLARPWMRAAAVAATLAFVAGGSWLASQTAMPRGANMIARGLPAAPAPGTPRPAPAAPPADQIAQQPPAPAAPAPLEDRATPGREPSARPEPAPLILQLALSVVRSGNDRSRLEIPPGAGQVEIRLRLDREEPFTNFSAILQNASTGEEIRREERITAREVDDLRAIVFSVPSTELKPGFYQVEVHGIAPEGNEFLGRPMFEVVYT